MKVNLTLTVDDADRYLIATFYRDHLCAATDVKRTRATRAQAKRFIAAAVRLALHDRRDALKGRRLAHALKLARQKTRLKSQREILKPPAERNERLFP